MSEIAVIGIGMGYPGGLTVEARDFCRSADLLIGAQRMLEAVAGEGQETCAEYLPDKITAAIEAHPNAEKIAVLMSGDIGFFSGAKKLLDRLPADTRIMPGISSAVYLCDKIGTSWNDVRMVSMHGQKCNIIGEICRNRKVFCLLGTKTAAAEICEKLVTYDLNDVQVTIGEELGYPDEKIVTGKPVDFSGYTCQSSLAVLFLENPYRTHIITHGIPDEDFLRDKVPMTKEEVRAVSISKLQIHEHSVVYDVGAGSGSVSIEAALQAYEGTVYSIEKNPTAIRLLYSNKLKFRADNMEIIEGHAPEALKDLPAPTHVFIGGSAGNMKDILTLVLAKNPSVRVVVNAITLETVHEAISCMESLPFTEPEVVSITTARAKKVARYHMMMGQNPVYILTAEGTGSVQETAETAEDAELSTQEFRHTDPDGEVL